MNLIDESFETKEQKDTKKTKKILIISIIVLFTIMTIITIVIMYIENTRLKVTINGVQNSNVTSMAYFDEENNLYFPIKEIAQYLEYNSFNGEYKGAYETNNQCYVKCENEIANFTVNSAEIYKLELNDEKTNYEKYIAQKPVKFLNGKLYASQDAIEKAFNTSISYDENKNKIKIYTMPYLIENYEKQATDKGYKKISEEFNNQKAILENELIVEKDDSTFAVLDASNGKEILDPKYDNIEYIPETGEFLVSVDEKVGIMKINKDGKAETKIKTSYTGLELIDGEAGLYLAQNEDKYGVIDSKDNKKIFIEYDSIGIDANDFEKNNIKNNYLLANNFILVQKGENWAVFNKNGKQLTDFKYDGFGYQPKTNKDIYSLLLIPEYNVLVANKNQKYILIDETGQELFKGVSFDDVYMTITAEKISYKLNYNDKTYDIIKQLEKQNVNAKEELNTEDDETNTKEKNTNNSKSNNETSQNKVTNSTNSTKKTTQNTNTTKKNNT